MNAENIKRALAMVHLHEAGNGGNRVAAYKAAITGSSLSREERLVLLRAINVDPSEVGES